MLDNFSRHADTVANEYHKALREHGKPLRSGLIAKGIPGSFLDQLGLIGAGELVPEAIYLQHERAMLLTNLPVPDQAQVIASGLPGGTPVDSVPIDQLRQYCTGNKDRKARSSGGSSGGGGGKSKRRPQRAPWVCSADGTLYFQEFVTWQEDCIRLKDAIGKDIIPVDVMAQLSDALASALRTTRAVGA